jgi:metallo-beta-lactamase family protein
MSVRIQFVGAAQTVTGSRHLVRTEQATILLDCGLYQGRRSESRARNEDLGFRPQDVDVVVLSHAHIDHSGALPLLCKRGYAGPIYATPATRDLSTVMLEDAAMIQQADATYLNRAIERGMSRGERVDAEPIEPLYDQRDVERVLGQMISIPYRWKQTIAPGVSLTFLDAGHILGSAITVLDIDDVGEPRRIVFTGDLGRTNMPILRDPEIPTGVDVLLTESTYGDRLHESRDEMDEELRAIVTKTCGQGGKVVIPSFALERAQEIILSLHRLRDRGLVPKVPVYVDSPLAVNVTQVFQLHPECFDEETAALLRADHSPFEFEGLRYVHSVEESKAIDASDEPSVIISASGMCEAGRILHHLKATIEEPKNAVVIVGFMAEQTLGRRIAERRPRVRIFGVERDLRAQVHVLSGFSAHADQADIIRFAEAVRERGPLRTVFLVHGEPRAQKVLEAMLSERHFPDVRTPAPGDAFDV